MAVLTPDGHGLGYNRDDLDHRDRLYAPRVSVSTLPSSFDLSALDPEIRDQGPAGSCTAFTGVGAFDYERRRQGLPFLGGSPLFLYAAERVIEGSFGTDGGAQIRTIGKALAQYGLCSEGEWPYDLAKLNTRPDESDFVSALNNQVLQYSSVAVDAQIMMACLFEGFEIMVGFQVYDGYERCGSDGMIKAPSIWQSPLGGHANRIVAYDATRARYSGVLFKTANSWSKSWGAQGYAWFPDSYICNRRYAADFWKLELVEGTTPPPPPPPPPPTPHHNVLAGIATAMAKEGDTPASDEYDVTAGVRGAWGVRGLQYVWLADTKTTYVSNGHSYPDASVAALDEIRRNNDTVAWGTGGAR
jgi:hypothetical protein